MSGRVIPAARTPFVVAIALGLAGCAPALREPAAIETLADEAAARAAPVAGDAPTLRARAASAFAAREPAAAREAIAAWLQAATLERDGVDDLIEAVRAGVWLAGREPDEATRRATAGRAVQAAQQCAARAPGEPRCDYWLAVALGVQARERRATALDALPRIVELLERAIAAAPATEHGGPHRVLALLLVRAPGWPSGPGDPDLALDHAREAVAIDGAYPPNRLALAEALAAVDERAAAHAEYDAAARLAGEAAGRGTPEAEAWLREAQEGLSR